MSDPMSKHKRHSQPRTLIGWLILTGLVAGLIIGLMGVSAFPDPCAMPLVYPLLMLIRYAPLQSAFWGGSVLTALVLLMLARRKRLSSTLVAVLMLVGGSLALYIWADSQWLPQIVSIKTYNEADTLYRLLYVSSEGTPLTDEMSPIRTFVLLDCDEWGGSVCRTVGVADMTLGGMGGFNTSDVDATHLYYLYEDYADETNRTLMLQIGDGESWEYVHAFIGCGVMEG